MQERRNSIANALELRISRTNPSICDPHERAQWRLLWLLLLLIIMIMIMVMIMMMIIIICNYEMKRITTISPSGPIKLYLCTGDCFEMLLDIVTKFNTIIRRTFPHYGKYHLIHELIHAGTSLVWIITINPNLFVYWHNNVEHVSPK